MEKVSEKLGVSIQTVRNNINRDIINLLKISIKEKNNLDRKCLNCNNQISIDRKGIVVQNALLYILIKLNMRNILKIGKMV